LRNPATVGRTDAFGIYPIVFGFWFFAGKLKTLFFFPPILYFGAIAFSVLGGSLTRAEDQQQNRKADAEHGFEAEAGVLCGVRQFLQKTGKDSNFRTFASKPGLMGAGKGRLLSVDELCVATST
jgi:hypothetical protein